MKTVRPTEIWANFSAGNEPVETRLAYFAKWPASCAFPRDDMEARKPGEVRVANELNVLALVKGAEHYVFVYDDDSRPLVIDTFRDQAADPGLSLNWFDAIVLTTKAREQSALEVMPLEPALTTNRMSGV